MAEHSAQRPSPDAPEPIFESSQPAEEPVFEEDQAEAPIFDSDTSADAPAADSTPAQPPGEAVDEGKGRIFPCEVCGADLEFHIGQQRLKCPFCGHEKEITLAPDAVVAEQDFEAMLARLESLRKKQDASADTQPDAAHEVRCESCGATVVFVGSLTSSACPYCGSPIQRENVHRSQQRVSVDGVLPFLVPRERAKGNLSRWIKSRWFAPDEFLKRDIDERFNGVYLPFWTYDSLTTTAYSGQRGEYYYVTVGSGKNRRSVRRTRWYPESGVFQRFFDDVLILASRGIPDDMMRNLQPWPLDRCIPFTQEALAGYLARTYERELDEGFHDARQIIDEELEADVRAHIGGDTQRVHSINTRYDAITFKHLLLPTWLMAYRFKERTYQVMVNAATGEVQGQRPYSWVKITLAVLAGLAVAAIVVAVVFLLNS